MKTFTNTSLVFLLFFLHLGSFSQIVGIKTGINLSNMLNSDVQSNLKKESLFGYHAGISLNYAFSETSSFEINMLISTKGYKVKVIKDLPPDVLEQKSVLRLLYIDIPLTTKIKLDLKNSRPWFAIGPYFGVGLHGTVKNKVELLSGDVDINKENINWHTEKDDGNLRRLDYGLTASAGLEIKTLEISIFNYFGLANLNSLEHYDIKLKNRVLGISIYYKFGGQ